jgi:DNA-3-methyladenine glycosylase
LVRYVDFLGKYYKLSGIIVETEAYGHYNDPASHAFKKMTNRNRAMFGDVGKIYVYFIYGNHYCLNIVAKGKYSQAGAVLIRSIQPLEGVNMMRIYRKSDNIINLTSGPGKLTQAFNIKKNHYGLDITNKNNNFFYLEDYTMDKHSNKFKVIETKRIGISCAIEIKWRFIMLNSINGEINGLSPADTQRYIPNPFLSKQVNF